MKRIGKVKTAVQIVRSGSLMTGRAALLILLALSVWASGCAKRTDTSEKLRDLEFTVLDKEAVPDELSEVIEEEKKTSFKISYADQGMLYIAEGYGGQPTSGYSVEVNGLYETEDAVCVETTLMGPEKGEKTEETVTYPYVVVQLEYIGKDVIFH